MICIQERNLHEALPTMCKLLVKRGHRVADDKVVRLDGPVSIELLKPKERVSFHPDLVVNPFAFFFAGMQMLAANIDGMKTFGKQLREDKVGMVFVVNVLDTYASFQRNRDRDLDCFVTGRSSDPIQDTIITSMMQELLAHLADCPVGSLWWQSMNVHVDADRALEACKFVANLKGAGSPYSSQFVEPYPLIDVPMNRWVRDLDTFGKNPNASIYSDSFFSGVMVPIHRAGIALQQEQFANAHKHLDTLAASDWYQACHQWIVAKSLRTP